MRCKNCGWPNKPGTTHCTKCNSPLTEGPAQPAAAPRPAGFPDQPAPRPAAPRQNEILGGTVFENDAFPERQAPAAPARPAAPAPAHAGAPAEEGTIMSGVSRGGQPTVCPKCGYPLRPDTDKCPNCRFQIKSAAAPETPAPAPARPVAPAPAPAPAPKPAAPAPAPAPKPAAPKEETIAFQRQATVNAEQAFQNAGKFSGTVNPLVQPIIHEFKLTLVPRQKEVLAQPEVAFEGESVSLNREKVDPNNSTITSREQACISYEDGKWFIEDKSTFQTTFVRAGRKTELRNGDVILMGDRMFIFGSDQED